MAWRHMLKRAASLKNTLPQLSATVALKPRFISISSCRYERYFSKEHEWVDVEGSLAKVGITNYAQEKLGEVVYVELPEVEDSFEKDDTVGAVESVKAASDVLTPVSGTIKEINESLPNNLNLVNKSPESDGWMFVIELSSPEELEELYNEEGYKSYCEEEDS